MASNRQQPSRPSSPTGLASGAGTARHGPRGLKGTAILEKKSNQSTAALAGQQRRHVSPTAASSLHTQTRRSPSSPSSDREENSSGLDAVKRSSRHKQQQRARPFIVDNDKSPTRRNVETPTQKRLRQHTSPLPTKDSSSPSTFSSSALSDSSAASASSSSSYGSSSGSVSSSSQRGAQQKTRPLPGFVKKRDISSTSLHQPTALPPKGITTSSLKRHRAERQLFARAGAPVPRPIALIPSSALPKISRSSSSSQQSHAPSSLSTLHRRRRSPEEKIVARHARAAYRSANDLNSLGNRKGLLHSLEERSVELIRHIGTANAEALGKFQNHVVNEATNRTRLSKKKGTNRGGGAMAVLDAQGRCFVKLLESGGKPPRTPYQRRMCETAPNYGIQRFDPGTNVQDIAKLGREILSLCKKIGSSMARVRRLLASPPVHTSRRLMNCGENPDQQEGVVQALNRAASFAGAAAPAERHLGRTFWSPLQSSLKTLASESRQRCMTVYGTQGAAACASPPRRVCSRRQSRRGLSPSSPFSTKRRRRGSASFSASSSSSSTARVMLPIMRRRAPTPPPPSKIPRSRRTTTSINTPSSSRSSSERRRLKKGVK